MRGTRRTTWLVIVLVVGWTVLSGCHGGNGGSRGGGGHSRHSGHGGR